MDLVRQGGRTGRERVAADSREKIVIFSRFRRTSGAAGKRIPREPTANIPQRMPPDNAPHQPRIKNRPRANPGDGSKQRWVR